MPPPLCYIADMTAGAHYAAAVSQIGVVLVAASLIHIMFGVPSVPSDPSTQIEGWRVVVTAAMGIASIMFGAHWRD